MSNTNFVKDMKRIDWYLQWAVPLDSYVNTPEEQELVTKFTALYAMAKGAKENNALVNSENITKWRKAYYGTLSALDADGKEITDPDQRTRQLRKLVYEFVEAKIDNNIPLPKMTPRVKTDLPLVQRTEDYLKYNIDNIFSKYVNDRSERSTYVDGTSWYKVWWDSLDNHPDHSGTVKIDVCLADQIVPQPGVSDWRQLEYVFELQQISLARVWDLFHRRITPISSDTSMTANKNEQVDMSTITMITCYYLNEDRVVGRFAWAQHSQQVICNEEYWQIRKLRKCTKCGEIIPQALVCPVCGSKSFRYDVAENEILDRDIMEVYNPYEVGETNDESQKEHWSKRVFASKGTEIPYYVVRQLPFVPRPAISSIESLYGISEAGVLLDLQDVANKFYTKLTDKTLDSSTVLTKPVRIKIDNSAGRGIKVLNVRSAEEAAMVQTKQIAADTSQDILAANMIYESARASSGVTESYQGKYDASATSGKAKEFAAMQTAGRIESLRIMKAAAFSGLYELVLKYLLAFSDGEQKFVKVLPNGNVEEESWSKYMFLDKDKYGQFYYRDDFKFSSDPAATLETNRVGMWQEIQSEFVQGAMGDPADPRTLELFWNMMDQYQYPLAKTVLAGIKDNAQHLPPQIEQLIMQNPQILQQVIAQFQQAGMLDGGATKSASDNAGAPTGSGDNRGGARPNSGPEGNGATHSANVDRTNERNRSKNQQFKDAVQGTQSGGSVQ